MEFTDEESKQMLQNWRPPDSPEYIASNSAIDQIEAKLAEYGKIPAETWIAGNDTCARVEWILCRLKVTENILVRYKKALEKIEKLSVAKEVRGELLDMSYPEHKVKEGGWVEIPSLMKKGLDYAARIAHECLWKIE